MKRQFMVPVLMLSLIAFACNSSNTDNQSPTASTEAAKTSPAGQSGVQVDVSKPNIVQLAVGSKDHSTLVTAVKAAGLADALSNAGPFTVFAPTNAGFDKLPAGTVEDLLKPEKKGDLENILGYHTYVGVLQGVLLQDGLEYEMVYGGKVKITKQGEKVLVNGKEIVASIPASNSIIHVINEVLIPPSK